MLLIKKDYKQNNKQQKKPLQLLKLLKRKPRERPQRRLLNPLEFKLRRRLLQPRLND
jgi:hypothetical protein